MKTIQEIQAEARQVAALGQQLQNESSAALATSPRVLAHFSESRLSTRAADVAIAEAGPGLSGQRYVDALIVSDALAFRLIEGEPDRRRADLVARDDAANVVLSSASAFDVLYAGYARAEQERLAEQLAPYAERDEDRERADRETINEVEAILEADLLPVADRIRTKAEIAEFLAGELDADELITRAIGRQCAREGQRETLTVRNELRLTIDEP